MKWYSTWWAVILALLPAPLFALDRAAQEKKAAAGEAEAQYQLAEALYWGQGGKQDLKQSVDWARLAAKQGHARGQYRLAVQLLFGHGVEANAENDRLGYKNLTQCHAGLQKEADAGNADAQFKLAQLHVSGLIEGPKDQPYKTNRKKAREYFEKAAQQGHARAQFRLALVYKIGLTENPDYKKTIEWLAKAARSGSVFAAHELWLAHIQSKGKLLNLEEAKPHLLTAAKAGLAAGQHLYGTALITGQLGGEADFKSGIEWIGKAAAQGYGPAQLDFASTWIDKRRGKPDLERAFYWMTLAGESTSKKVQADSTRYADALRKKLTFDRQFEIKQEAKKFQPKATTITRNARLGLAGAAAVDVFAMRIELVTALAKAGNVVAMLSLGHHYRRTVNIQDSIDWYTAAAKKDNLAASKQLWKIYLNGLQGRLQPDKTKALGWLKKAADRGDLMSMNRLGVLLMQGEIKGGNPKEGVEWIRKSATAGWAHAQVNLGRFYYEGDQVEQDFKVAHGWFQKAAAQRYKSGQFYVADCYMRGRGVPNRDVNEALKWYRLAALQGHANAQFALGNIYLEGTGGVEKNARKGYEWLEISRSYGKQGVETTLKRYENRLSQEQKKQAVEAAKKFRAVDFYVHNPNAEEPGPKAAEDFAKKPLEEVEAKAKEGNGTARFELAKRHAAGNGVKLDPVKAWMWFQLADDAGHRLAADERSKLVKAQRMNLSQVLKARKLVREFKQQNKK